LTNQLSYAANPVNQTPKWVILFKVLDNDSIFFVNGGWYHTIRPSLVCWRRRRDNLNGRDR